MPTFTSVKYVSDVEGEDEDNDEPPPLLFRSECSSSDEDEDQATKTARSNNKVVLAMRKLSGTSYNAMPERILKQARTGLRAPAVDLVEIEMFRKSQT